MFILRGRVQRPPKNLPALLRGELDVGRSLVRLHVNCVWTRVRTALVVRREWAQGLKEVSYAPKTVLEGCAQVWTCVRHRLILTDGVQLEVLTIHGNVGSESLQVQIAQVQLHTQRMVLVLVGNVNIMIK